MKCRLFLIIIFCYIFHVNLAAQGKDDIVFIADIQAPTWPEKISHKKERNIEAADSLFSHLLKQEYRALFLLGDLVSLGYSDDAWVRIDRFLDKTRKNLIPSYAVPGNHEYFFRSAKGIENLRQRFPYVPLTGYCKVIDSLAIVMLNSNFKKMSDEEVAQQQKWYVRAMDSLNNAQNIKAIIVCCHHSPYTNSKEVGVSKEVQQRLVPAYVATPKAVLFLSGHAHDLELFSIQGKYFMVIGGGGGVAQPMKTGDKSAFADLSGTTPRFFYLIIHRFGDELQIFAKGFSMADFGKIKSIHVKNISTLIK